MEGTDRIMSTIDKPDYRLRVCIDRVRRPCYTSSMPRGPRLDIEESLHHVMVQGLEKRNIFRTRKDREDFLGRLGYQVTSSEAKIYAWCLMANHAHLLVKTGPAPLSTLMRRLLTGYAVAFNRRHNRVGHVFGNRYKSILVEEKPYLLELVRYIHLNPVRHKIVKTVETLSTYPWTGHAALLGHEDRPWQEVDYILTKFDPEQSKARRAYQAFVRKGVTQGRRPELTGGGLLRSAGGREEALKVRRNVELWASDERILGSSAFVKKVLQETGMKEEKGAHEALDLPALMKKVAAKLDVPLDELARGRRKRQVVEARSIISYVAMTMYGIALKQLADALNVSKQSILRGLDKGEGTLIKVGWNVNDLVK